MIANLYTEESPASRMLDMIARCAPRLMRCGGGPLQREDSQEFGRLKHTPRQVETILALGRTGKFSATEIAVRVGSNQTATRKVLMRHGVRLPDGRAMRGTKQQRRALA